MEYLQKWLKILPGLDLKSMRSVIDNEHPCDRMKKHHELLIKSVKKKRKTRKNPPVVIGETIGRSGYAVKDVAIHITASSCDNEASVKSVVQKAFNNYNCKTEVTNISKNEKLSTYRVKMSNMPKCIKSDFYAKTSWPLNWTIRKWRGDMNGKITKILRLKIDRLDSKQELEPLIDLIKSIKGCDVEVKAEFIKTKPKTDSKTISFRSCKLMIEGAVIPSYNDLVKAFQDFYVDVKFWKGPMIFDDRRKPILIEFDEMSDVQTAEKDLKNVDKVDNLEHESVVGSVAQKHTEELCNSTTGGTEKKGSTF